MTLHNRDFLTLKDFSQKEITYLLNLAAKLKKDKKAGITHGTLKGKNVALIFEKPSTRTRCAFTVACADEGGYSEYLGKNEIQLGHKESVEDTARVLSRMFDGIEFRGFSHEKVETLAKYSDVPVWNGLTDDYHPTQILADFLTIQEKLGKLAGDQDGVCRRRAEQYGQQSHDRLCQNGLAFRHCRPKGASAGGKSAVGVPGFSQR